MPTLSPGNIGRTALKVFIFGAVVPFLLYHLGKFKPVGGDYVDTIGRVLASLYYFAHAPLVTAAHRIAYLAMSDHGWYPEQVVAASSSLAGGLFFAGLWKLSRNWRVWAVMICSSLTLVFVGHVENYAWPYALTFWALI